MGKPIIYEVNIRQYTEAGTFAAFMQHLPRLQEMGVTILWFMPIQPIGKINRKGSLGSYYSIADYYGINEEFGTINDFKYLVDEAHHYGFKVIIDWVANHTAWDHVWVQKHPEFYAKNKENAIYSPNDWEDVVQLDHSNMDQAITMANAMQYWLEEFGIDGFRCDMAHLIPLENWGIIKSKLNINKKLIWIGETNDNQYFKEFDYMYGWEWLHGCNQFVSGEKDINYLKQIINSYIADSKKNKHRLLFTTNHDENSWQGTEYERLKEYCIPLTLLSWLLPGAALIYSGQEEPVLERLAFFDRNTITWKNFKNKPIFDAFFALAKTLNNTTTNFDWINTSNKTNIIVFQFITEKNKYIVQVNLSDTVQVFTMQDNKVLGTYKELFNTESFKYEDNLLPITNDVLQQQRLQQQQLIVYKKS